MADRQFPCLSDRHGGLLGLPLSRAGLAGPRARAAADAPQVRQALCQAGEERLEQRRGPRGGLPASDDALRAPQMGSAAGHAGLHRVRQRLVRSRTRLINQLQPILLKRGIAAPQGRRKLEQRLPEILQDVDNGLWPRVRELLAELRAE